jgi:hypothetical protein
MKTSLLTLTFAIILTAGLIGTSSNSRAEVKISENKASFVAYTNEKEVIIQVEDSNEKNLPAIRNSIEQSGGMRFKGYCKTLKVLLYIMDTDVHPDLGFLNAAFMSVSMGYLIKEGTILQVQNLCNMPDLIDPSQSQH